MVKCTVLGGSSVAVPELISAINPYMHRDRELEIVLHGRRAAEVEAAVAAEDPLSLATGLAKR